MHDEESYLKGHKAGYYEAIATCVEVIQQEIQKSAALSEEFIDGLRVAICSIETFRRKE